MALFGGAEKGVAATRAGTEGDSTWAEKVEA